MLINIWVKDNDSGVIHQVGTDRHDSLEMINGRVEYYNLQNGCGTPDIYSFVEAPDADDYISITPEEMLLNKAYCDDRILESIRNRPQAENKKLKAENQQMHDQINRCIEAIKDFEEGFTND